MKFLYKNLYKISSKCHPKYKNKVSKKFKDCEF